MKPTRRLILIAAAGLPLALLPVLVDARLWTVWPVFVGCVVLVAGIDALRAPRRAAIRCAAEIPETLHIGRDGCAALTIALGSRRSFDLEVVVDLSDELAPQPRSRLRAAGEALFTVELKPRRRGTARLERVWVGYASRLGLVRFDVQFPFDRPIAIVPDIAPVRSVALRFSDDREFRAGLKIERFRGEGTEFDSLKEFTVGDDPRAIDWKHSARHKKLLARQFRAERDHQVILAVDSGRLMSEPLEGIPKLDHALNAALLLSYVCLRSGDRVGMFSFDARVGLLLEPQGGMRAQWALTQMTSRVTYSDAETNFTLGLTTLTQRVRRRSLVIVLTDFVDTLTAELMLENMGRLARRHVVVFVALRDPQLDRVAAAEPSGTLALNRAVVAQSFIRDRAVVLHRLRRLGILPIDAEPRRIGSRLINSYLDIKRREMI